MDIPTEEDIERLALADPVVHLSLHHCRNGDISLDEAMRLCVSALVQQNAKLKTMLQDEMTQRPTRRFVNGNPVLGKE